MDRYILQLAKSNIDASCRDPTTTCYETSYRKTTTKCETQSHVYKNFPNLDIYRRNLPRNYQSYSTECMKNNIVNITTLLKSHKVQNKILNTQVPAVQCLYTPNLTSRKQV